MPLDLEFQPVQLSIHSTEKASFKVVFQRKNLKAPTEVKTIDEPSADAADLHELNFFGSFKVKCNFHCSNNEVQAKRAYLAIIMIKGNKEEEIAKEYILLNALISDKWCKKTIKVEAKKKYLDKFSQISVTF